MYGNIINSGEIARYENDGRIYINPFSKNKIQTIHYPVHAEFIKRKKDGVWKTVKNFSEEPSVFKLEPREYVQVAILEHIKLQKGIVGEFSLTSNTIDEGLGLFAGRIEYPFGEKNERMHIGIKNLFDTAVVIKPLQKIAYLKFIDTTGMISLPPSKLSDEDKKRFKERIVDTFYEMSADGGISINPDEHDIVLGDN
ncbi:MAG: hypothetical protein ABJR05_16645 [Balneola sp.]